MAEAHPNPELEHVPRVAEATQAAQDGYAVSTVHHETHGNTIEKLTAAEQEDSPAGSPPSGVYVTKGVPDLLVEVLPGQHVKSPDGHPQPGDYWGDAEDEKDRQFIEEGPTAHMLEARGFVKVLGVAK